MEIVSPDENQQSALANSQFGTSFCISDKADWQKDVPNCGLASADR
jgi:hypothetical protein